MKNDLSFSSVIEDYENVEKKVTEVTKKYPIVMLGAAAGLGFAVGCFGLMRVVQAGIALKLQDKFSLKDILGGASSIKDATKSPNPQAHA